MKALVSDEDAVYLSLLCSWCYHNKGYAYAPRIGLMHVIVGKRIGLISQIDHEDRNKLNNQRSNLRTATSSQNKANVEKYVGDSQYKGVSWHKHANKWVAQIHKDYKHIHIGYFENELDAAFAYDKEAQRLFGPYANLNFPGVT